MSLRQFQHPHTLMTLEALCLMGTGFIAGAFTYISLIEVPGRANKSPAYQLENYHEIFPRAARLMKSSIMIFSLTMVATALLTDKKTWWIPGGLIGSLGPFTAIVIQPTNKKLMAAQDGDKVKEDLKNWGKWHNVRTYMSLLGFAGAVAAVME